MRSLAIFIGVGWASLLFYGAGPLSTPEQFAVGGVVLAASCLVCVLWGAFGVVCRRAKPESSVGPDRPSP